MLLNDDPHASLPTIIVSGPPRAGTSFVGAALKAAGLWLGENIDESTFEDIDIAYAAECKTTPYQRLGQVARFPAQWRSALGGLNVATVKNAIQWRNERHRQWGFKRPNIVHRLGRDGVALFRNPHVILCFRDPVALAQRTMISSDISARDALRATRYHCDVNLKSLWRLSCPTLLVSFEKSQTNRIDLLRDIFAFCRLDVPAERIPSILEYVDQAGERYRQRASAPILGAIDPQSGWILSGWCHPPRSTGSVAVDVFVDGTKLTTIFADLHRPDLVIAGFKSFRHGFLTDLSQFGLNGSEIIDVYVSETDIKLLNSGCHAKRR